MKKLNTLLFAVLAVFFVACDDNNDDSQEADPYIVPESITLSENNMERTIWFFYEGAESTRIRDFVIDEGTGGLSTAYNITYDQNGRVEAITEKRGNTTRNYTYTYTAGVEPRSTLMPPPTLTLVEKKENGELISEFWLSNNYLNTATVGNVTKAFYHSGNNVSTITAVDNDNEPLYKYKYMVNEGNGVFKNVTTPQWVFVLEMSDFDFAGQFNNNVKEIEITRYPYTYPFPEKDKYTYNYLSFGINNLPTKIEANFTSAYTQARQQVYTIKYMSVK